MQNKTEYFRIYEMNYDVHPNGERVWEILDEVGDHLVTHRSAKRAVEFCLERGVDFSLHTLAAWEEENGTEVPTATTKEWSHV